MTSSRKVGNRFGYSKKETKENLGGGNKLEELLNKLIERGWYPFCDNNVKEIRIYSDMDIECIYGKRKSDFYYTSYRKLTSKESGLWQFVCENRLIEPDHMKQYNGYEYRLIESALKDESELEYFLLSNIKIDG